MKHALMVLTCVLALSAYAAETKKPMKANGSIELTDPAGDVQPIHTADGKDYPGNDVVKLSLKSDGKQLAVAATLKNPPGAFASGVVEIYFDTDNNRNTGVELAYPNNSGFEYTARLDACADYTDGSSSCSGGGGKPKTHWAAVDLNRYKGTSRYDKENVVDSMGFFGGKKSLVTPITGNVVQGVFDYNDLHVKSGQTIRLLILEAQANNSDSGFPEVVLTLK